MAKKRYNGRTKRAHIYLGGGLLGSAASLASNAISGGMSTGVGSAMQTLGGIASNIPGVGGIIGAGVNVLGGIVNKAFGSTINEEFVANTKASAQENAARKFDSSSAESVLQQQGDYQDMNLVSKDDVGKDGWFSDKAKNLAKSLNKQIQFSNTYNRDKLDMAFSNADEQEGLNLLSGYFGYGGPMMFKNGGGIHIKKANRGKFTEYCGGKVTSACIARGKHSSSPAVRKRATFAQNARGWKHADGGPLEDLPTSRDNPNFDSISSQFDSRVDWNNSDRLYNMLSNRYGHTTASAIVATINKESLATPKQKQIGGGNGQGIMQWTSKDRRNRLANFRTDMTDELERETAFLMDELEGNGNVWTKGNHKSAAEARRLFFHPNTSLDEKVDILTQSFVRPKDMKGQIKERKNLSKSIHSLYNPKREATRLAFGGSLVHGGDFTNGITFIGSGGTHEQNPFEGVQMGINPDGEPNLVEEGEVVYNDYVFSNRLKVPKKAKRDFKLKGETFADAAKALQKESEERPNDPISKRGLEASMGRLVGIQEEMRNKRNKGRRFDKGGPLGVEEDFNLPDYTNQNRLAMSLLGDTPRAYMGSSGNIVTPEGGIDIGVGTGQQQNDEEQDLAPTWMRYAPVAGSVGSVLSDMFGATNKPDYGPADYINGAIQPVKPVGARTVSNYLTYKPLDTDYMTNKLNANRSAQRRAITNTSGGNRATAMAGLIASDYNYGNQLGDLTRQAAMYNDQQRQQVEAFNRGTNQYNAEALTKADMANANIQQQTNELRLKQRSAQAQMRDAANTRSSAARSANLTNLLDNLGAVGQENFMKNMITTNPALYYDLTGKGAVKYKGNGKKKRGGKLTYGR